MIVHEPIPHWNNFTVPELKEILQHYSSLERLGIAQDEEMMISIERDIKMREKEIRVPYAPFEAKQTKIKQQTEKQNRITINQRQQPQDYLLKQNV